MQARRPSPESRQLAADARRILDAKPAECVPLLERMIDSRVGELRAAGGDPAQTAKAEKAIAENPSAIPSVRSVAILGQERDRWGLHIIHDDGDIRHALHQIISRIIEIEEMPPVPMLEPQLMHVSEGAEVPAGARIILQR